MKLIVGLGNPGSQYDKTRHNAGFLAVDRLAARHPSPSGSLPRGRFSGVAVETVIAMEKCLLLKPTTYMNLSGRSVAEAIGFFKLDPSADLLVLVDDAALPGGAIRLRAGGSAGGHNGLASVEQSLGTAQYPRLRIGVDPCPHLMKLEDYVLGRFTPEQWAVVDPALDRAAKAVEVFVARGLPAAMNEFNKPDPPPASVPPTPGPANLSSNPPLPGGDRRSNPDTPNRS